MYKFCIIYRITFTHSTSVKYLINILFVSCVFEFYDWFRMNKFDLSEKNTQEHIYIYEEVWNKLSRIH